MGERRPTTEAVAGRVDVNEAGRARDSEVAPCLAGGRTAGRSVNGAQRQVFLLSGRRIFVFSLSLIHS